MFIWLCKWNIDHDYKAHPNYDICHAKKNISDNQSCFQGGRGGEYILSKEGEDVEDDKVDTPPPPI